MALACAVTPEQRNIFESVSARLLREEGAEAIMLGGTDLALEFNEHSAGFPVVDCAGIHVDAVVRLN